MDREDVLSFIQLVEQHDVLWNRNSSLYKDINAHSDAWEDISKTMNIPTSAAIYKPTWFAYEAMDFMKAVRECKSTLSTLTQS
ncbi:uncharacterized protein LOC128718303 [Anopheles marshallii]|uniref:uncharacterized protein LOC128718303 n=1 Tax=Anopheles marshallii TaxID=1521116 RepID=UPI00237C0349|nr:uncharacterized protein LOC128718303 [Anopheles marshallii]